MIDPATEPERSFGQEQRILKWLSFGCNILILLIAVSFFSLVFLAEDVLQIGTAYLMLNLVVFIYLVAICGMLSRILRKIERQS